MNQYYYMALSFKNLRDPKLGMFDKITFGKLKDCRICDVIQDHYEYLIWAEKEGYMKYQPIVVETIMEHASFPRWEPPEDEEPKILDTYEMFYKAYKEEDIPF